MPCLVCLGEGQFPLTCKQCKGWGLRLCDPCLGGRKVCRSCSGTGRQRYVTGNRKAGTRKCTQCNGKGWSKCEECNGMGVFTCPPFEGAEPCKICKDRSGCVPCTVCDDKDSGGKR